ncbi:hypothetical protein MLD38_011879 [Melastoma candidum]|uniref:Uncharacterized protein n=1 Tax=Melastoma candidum TaxID=119954 RepID=A0ACB9R4L2_9MYRT|nr:hypothetical protein MLD38_011879 [Melastoma candidum]
MEISDYLPESLRSHQTLLFFAYFLAAYISAYFLLFRRWDPTPRAFASSCFTSLFHGTPALLLSLAATYPHPPRSYSLPNTPSQDSVLEFSTAYFLLDLLHYLLFFPSDLLFIIHHVATLYVLLTCRYIVLRGAYPILLLLILAEVTSPCQNTWSLARTCRSNSPSADRLVRFLSPKFYTFYSIVRGVIAPLYVLDLTYSYWKDSRGMPRWAWTSWVVIMAVGIAASMLWVRDKWSVWRKERDLDPRKTD